MNDYNCRWAGITHRVGRKCWNTHTKHLIRFDEVITDDKNLEALLVTLSGIVGESDQVAQ